MQTAQPAGSGSPAPLREIVVIRKSLDNGCAELETLFFPEISQLDDGEALAADILKQKVVHALAEMPLNALCRLAAPAAINVSITTVPVQPAKRKAAWREPVSLALQILDWPHEEAAWVVYVPALGIEVIAPDRDRAMQRLPAHIHSALVRDERLKSLGRLLPLGRWQELSVERTSVAWQPATPAAIEKKRDDQGTDYEATLQVAATLQEPAQQAEAYEVDDAVESLARILTGPESRSALLVGPASVGKTAVFRECIRRGASVGLDGYKVWMTTGSRLVAGMSGFGMWQERCIKICRAMDDGRTILHVGSLLELLQVGCSEHNQQGIASFLRPYIERRDILVVAECTPEQLLLIETREPRLVDAFAQLKIEEASPEQARRILSRWATAGAERSGRRLAKDAIDAVDRLHRRFGGYSVHPGRALRFIRNLLDSPRQGTVIGRQQVFEEFARETGLPAFLIDESQPMDLGETGQWFRQRVLGQETAVSLVVDLLATVKAKLSRPRKPIASLVFIGPTGVGKTQMAKCLAEYLFGDAHRLVRFDMSEFADEAAVKRLVGDVTGDEGLLTSRVREQPFSIVLFDEFEKADPLFYDLMLQVLGEGRLTDGAGRLADFTNSVIIMTSNLGAESFSRTPPGFTGGQAEEPGAAGHFSQQLQGFLRPELFNRIDAVVPFASLDPKVILAVARRELELVGRREGLSGRKVKLQLDDLVVEWLADKGFDEKYGARPLKRALQEQALVPLAEGLNAYDGTVLLEAQGTRSEDGIKVRVRPWLDKEGRNVPINAAGGTADTLGLACGSLRRKVMRLKGATAYAEANNLAYRLKSEAAKTGAKRRTLPAGRFGRVGIEMLLKDTNAFENCVSGMEDAALLSVFGHGVCPAVDMTAFQTQWDDLMLRYWDLQISHPTDRVCLGLYSLNRGLMQDQLAAYAEIARALKYATRLLALVSAPPEKPGDRAFRRVPLRNLAEAANATAADHQPSAIGLVIEISGRMVQPIFAVEVGAHTFTSQGKEEVKNEACIVHAEATSLEQYTPLPGVESSRRRLRALPCRTYDTVRREIRDERIGRVTWHYENLGSAIAAILERIRQQALEKLLTE